MPVTPSPLLLRACTHAGLVRAHNEDALSIHPEIGLAILADGMGGSRAGEVAATMAVRHIHTSLQHHLHAEPHARPWPIAEAELLLAERLMREAVSRAHEAIVARGQADPRCSGMGTTVVLALRLESQLLIGHVGDSRAYLLRQQNMQLPMMVCRRHELMPLTRDHSSAQATAPSRRSSVTEGTAPSAWTGATRLTRALGVEEDPVLELHRHRLEPGDVLLLCTDGLSDMVSESRIESIINDSLHEDAQAHEQRLDQAAQSLLSVALNNGGRDNISLILGMVAPSHAEA